MAGFTVDCKIKTSLRVPKDHDLYVVRKHVLNNIAVDIQEEARKQSRDKGPSYLGKGRVSGKMELSIQILDEKGATFMGRYPASSTGRTVYLYVGPVASETETGSGSYASFQELGTGIYSEAPGASKQPIRPSGGRAMRWIQHGQAYRGVNVIAAPLGGKEIVVRRKRPIKIKGGGGFIRSYTKTVATSWKQFATEIHGIRPKHFMRKAFRVKNWSKVQKDMIAEVSRHWLRLPGAI